jgi:hypothetical protein
MKRLLWIAVALAASVALADKNLGTWIKIKSETYTVANSLATNVAALTATSGVDFNGGGGIAAAFCAESTRTITSGTMRAYIWMPFNESPGDGGTAPGMMWIPFAPLDVTLAAGHRCSLSGDKQAWSGFGRIAWVEDDAVVSAGTTLVTTYTRRLGTPIENK